MCGITGWIDWEQDLTHQRWLMEKMTKTLTPRGPDFSGLYFAEHAALGHRRLVVVDPQGGVQPMVRKRGENTYVLVYNGELYNTPELRRELAARGHSFQGHSDTEVLLLSYIEWGKTCVEKFNGIFAFAIWDSREQSLFLARDRMGVKPLFYARRGSAFLFASEIKALLAHPAVKPEIDREGLAEVLVMGPARTPGHGVFRDVQEVRPGYSVTYDRDGLSPWRFWSLQSRPHEDDLTTTTNKVRELFLDTVKRQLVSDVPLCTFLSGGLDSSAITSVAAHVYKEQNLGPLPTFSIDYVGNDIHFKSSEFQPNSDAPFAKLMSESCETIHTNVFIDIPQLVEALRPAVLARDLPGMADVDSSLLLFCKEIKTQATVALSGECADEVFGGYPWFRSEEALNAGTFPWSRKLTEKLSLFSPEVINLTQPELYMAKRYQDTLAEVPHLPGDSPRERKMREMFYLNLIWFMSTLLDRKDRMSMACGLEVRVPFCDHRLVEYVWNIPWEMKFCDQREKGILRRALEGILPETILTRRKSPYPKTHNPAYTAAVSRWLVEILNDPASPLLSLIDRKNVLELTKEDGQIFDRPWFGQLMTGPQLFAYLIQLDIWLREYKVRVV